jgi:DNA ligase D-like protein (predicted 3'-phosphoesterase)
VIKKLSEYQKKRDLTKSPETKARITSTRRKSLSKTIFKKNIFVIQQHHATQMHFDFRIQIGSVLKSWAIPRGPSTNPRVKRLAALTEDHPLDYARFEGIIPDGYGAGTVIVWDTGTYENLNKINGRRASMQRAFATGFIKIALKGKKLKGAYALVYLKEKNWLLVKVRDEHANAKTNPARTKPKSVISKKTIKELDKKFAQIKKNKLKKTK